MKGSSDDPVETQDEVVEEDDKTFSTPKDREDMRRVGKKPELRRRLRLPSSICLVVIALPNWIFSIFFLQPGLINGGRSGVIWIAIANFLGFISIYLSMAEMASIAPISGAQYHWVSEFSPRKYQRILSYYTGWLSTLSWQSSNASSLLLTGTTVQTIVSVLHPSYDPVRYQGVLITIAMIIPTILFNIYGLRYLPIIQNIFAPLQLILFFIFVISVFVLAPRLPPAQVFANFTNVGDWPTLSLAIFVGQVTSMPVGYDTAAHMAEETKDARRNVPTGMMVAYIYTTLLAVIVYITICFGLTDLEAALSDNSGYAVVWLLRRTFSPTPLAVFLVAVEIMLFLSNVSYTAAVARDLFAFCRDEGFPLKHWLSKVNPKYGIPVNAVIFTGITSALMSFIYIGSITAFYALVSLSISAILLCYALSIGSILWLRITSPERIPYAEWSLGKYGILCNALGFSWSVWCFFWSFWPQFFKFREDTFNWAIVIFAGVMVLSTVYFWLSARKHYKGPVLQIKEN